MSKVWRRGMALAVAAACLALVGCSSGGDGGRVSTLEADLAALEELRDELQTAQKALEKQAATEKEAKEKLQGDLDTEKEAKEKLQGELTTEKEAKEKLQGELTTEKEAKKTAQDKLDTERETRHKAEIELAKQTIRIEGLTKDLKAAQTAKTKAEADLKTAQQALDKAKTDATKTATDVVQLRAQVRTLTNEVATQKTRITKLEADLDTAKKAATTTTATHPGLVDGDDDDMPPQQPQQPVTQQPIAGTQTAEANQRAQNLKEAFPAAAPDPRTALPAVAAVVSPVATTVPARGRLLLKHGGFRDATLSGAGIRSATMALTAGGNTGKTVVYTDRELSRSLLDHYGNRRPSSTAVYLDMEDSDWSNTSISISSDTDVKGKSGPRVVSHGFMATKNVAASGGLLTEAGIAALAAAANMKSAASYPGNIHGVSGTFQCSVANCKVKLAATYVAGTIPSEATRVAATLSTVTVITDVEDAKVYFRPTGPAMQLYEEGVVGVDAEYMIFGYWREDPSSPAGDYDVVVFAQAFGTERTVTGLTARYDGTAVGMYVEQDPNDPVDTHRQGEFTANVGLKVDDGTVTGTIGDFETTPTDGSAAPRTSRRWLVELEDGGQATIENLTGVKSGSWERSFVPAHANASDTEPPAVTGTFNTRILDFVHLHGAIGAEKR